MTQDRFGSLVGLIVDHRDGMALKEVLDWSHNRGHSADHLFRLMTHVDGFGDTKRREWDYTILNCR